MENRWSESEAAQYEGDPVASRAYSSRLLGAEPGLVLHGGGNTSVKVDEEDFFGAPQTVLYVKGSGWDLASIQPPGFAPVKLEVLLEMARLESLSDADMVKIQRTAMTDPSAPNPSVEAILHAVIPHRFVDHSHADAVVALSNTPDGAREIADLYGDRVLIVPYVMPGFILAREVFERTRDADWTALEGMILLNHGVFTFGETAREAYDQMIALVSEAEDRLRERGALDAPVMGEAAAADPLAFADLRRAVGRSWGRPVVARLDRSAAAAGFAGREDVARIATRGPVTPDHVIRTKRVPMIASGAAESDVASFAQAYRAYFEAHDEGALTCLDPAPRWAVWPGQGIAAFGASAKKADQVADIVRHTARAIQWGEALGGWTPLPLADIFEMEYWELEQAKLKRAGAPAPFEGRVALVTGAAGGIGRAAAEALSAAGAAVVALDVDPSVVAAFDAPDRLGIACDVTDTASVDAAFEVAAMRFGGVDILVSNAGTFPPGKPLAELDDESWATTLAVNLTSHQKVLRAALPYLERGFDPAVVVVGSKNVPAPGPGVGAYSASKAGLTQLARVAALELGPKGIRVNVLHPNAVFDTGIWDEAKIAARAERYGLTPQAYRTNNVLGVEVSASHVADLVVAMAGPLFSRTTGAQVAVDGGNDRVI